MNAMEKEMLEEAQADMRAVGATDLTLTITEANGHKVRMGICDACKTPHSHVVIYFIQVGEEDTGHNMHLCDNCTYTLSSSYLINGK